MNASGKGRERGTARLGPANQNNVIQLFFVQLFLPTLTPPFTCISMGKDKTVKADKAAAKAAKKEDKSAKKAEKSAKKAAAASPAKTTDIVAKAVSICPYFPCFNPYLTIEETNEACCRCCAVKTRQEGTFFSHQKDDFFFNKIRRQSPLQTSPSLTRRTRSPRPSKSRPPLPPRKPPPTRPIATTTATTSPHPKKPPLRL